MGFRVCICVCDSHIFFFALFLFFIMVCWLLYLPIWFSLMRKRKKAWSWVGRDKEGMWEEMGRKNWNQNILYETIFSFINIYLTNLFFKMPLYKSIIKMNNEIIQNFSILTFHDL